MKDEGTVGNQEALAQARETIERQAAQIQSLQRKVEAARGIEEVHDALRLAAIAGTIATPLSHGRLLEMIVETASQVISAQAAALFLLDEATEELVFEVALGQKAEEVKRFRVPLGHGIAGLVAVTGQPMAISDAQNDPRHAGDIAQSVGYTPQSILCVPLYYNEQVIGVLELLDKSGGRAFSGGDMMTLGFFANLAAVAIEQSRIQQSQGALIGQVLRASLDEADGVRQQRLEQGVQALAGDLEGDSNYRRSLEMARLVEEITARGEEEAVAARTILQGFADYLRARPAWGAEWEALR